MSIIKKKEENMKLSIEELESLEKKIDLFSAQDLLEKNGFYVLPSENYKALFELATSVSFVERFMPVKIPIQIEESFKKVKIVYDFFNQKKQKVSRDE